MRKKTSGPRPLPPVDRSSPKALVRSLERASALAECEREVVRAARWGYSLAFERSAAAAPGASRAGGDPDLPASMPWPSHPGDPGVPLSFLCQINLDELPDCGVRGELPAGGMVYFFHGNAGCVPLGLDWPAGFPAAVCVYAPPGGALAPRTMPRLDPTKYDAERRERFDGAGRWRGAPYAITVRPSLSLPPSLDEIAPSIGDDVNLSGDAYDELRRCARLARRGRTAVAAGRG